MKMEVFEMERAMSTWENMVEYDISESGVKPICLRDLVEMDFDLEGMMDKPLGYSQANGTIELREILARQYPGAGIDNIEVTNGTSEANYVLAITLLEKGDELALAIPNYMQLEGVAKAAGAKVNKFSLRHDNNWEVDWEEFERAVNPNTKLVYITRPSNPTGSILSEESVERIIKHCEEMEAYLVSDEVYIGAEIDGSRTKTCWGMSDRVIVTSGLSKAYGIPGIRIGWLVGPEKLVAECWSQHDYITIGPNILSDAMAQVAVNPRNREKLYARTRQAIKGNLPIYRQWVKEFEGLLEFNEPAAGAFCFIKYNSDIPSQEISEKIITEQSTLIAPGSHFGMEGYFRMWMGGETEFIKRGLERVGKVLKAIM
jgi:aspartate/methionine/tyrosine aminotransferase